MKNPQEFYNECVAEYHLALKDSGYVSKGLVNIPELLPIGQKVVLEFLNDSFFKSQFGNDAGLYYYAITCLSIQAGIVFATKWNDDFSGLNEYIDKIIEEGPADDSNAIMERVFGLNQDECQTDIFQIVFEQWLKLHRPYWELEDPRDYTFSATVAAYQLGVSLILDKASITGTEIEIDTEGHGDISGTCDKAVLCKAALKHIENYAETIFTDNDLVTIDSLACSFFILRFYIMNNIPENEIDEYLEKGQDALIEKLRRNQLPNVTIPGKECVDIFIDRVLGFEDVFKRKDDINAVAEEFKIIMLYDLKNSKFIPTRQIPIALDSLSLEIDVRKKIHEFIDRLMENSEEYTNIKIVDSDNNVDDIEGIVCQNCGAEILEDSQFCHKCGTKVGGIKCPKCGKEQLENSLFCRFCGAKINDQNGEREQEPDKINFQQAKNILKNCAGDILDKNGFLQNGAVKVIEDIFEPEDFIPKILEFCKNKYSKLGDEKVKGEIIITSYYGSMCATIFYDKDKSGITKNSVFDYLNEHIDIEFTDVSAETMLGTEDGEEKANEIWEIIRPYLRVCNAVFDRIDSLDDNIFKEAMSHAYLIGMVVAKREVALMKKSRSLSREEINKALEKLAESASDYEDPPPQTAMCYSRKAPITTEIIVKCDLCGAPKELTIQGSCTLVDQYRALANKFVEIGHNAKFTCLCDRCAQEKYPSDRYSKNNFVFEFYAKESNKPVVSFPSSFKYSDYEYRLALEFLQGVNSVSELAEKTNTHHSASSYINDIKEIIGDY